MHPPHLDEFLHMPLYVVHYNEPWNYFQDSLFLKEFSCFRIIFVIRKFIKHNIPTFQCPLLHTLLFICNFPVSTKPTPNITYTIHFFYMTLDCFRAYAQCNCHFLCTNFIVFTNQIQNLHIQFVLRDILRDIVVQIRHHNSKLISVRAK